MPHAVPSPPVAEKTRGVNEACSNSLFVGVLLQSFVFSIASSEISVTVFERACGLNTLTSQKVLSCLPPQNPLTATSSLAPSCVLVYLCTLVPPGISAMQVVPLVTAEVNYNKASDKSS